MDPGMFVRSHVQPTPPDRARRDVDEGSPSWNAQLVEPLTRRELDVLRLVCDGESNLQIGERLGIGIATVKYHLTQIFEKLRIRRRTQAVAIAVYLGLAHPRWVARAAEESRRHDPGADGHLRSSAPVRACLPGEPG